MHTQIKLRDLVYKLVVHGIPVLIFVYTAIKQGMFTSGYNWLDPARPLMIDNDFRFLRNAQLSRIFGV